MGAVRPNTWYRIVPRLGVRREAFGEALSRSPWFLMEAWGGERLRLYLASPLGESVLRRVVGLRREEPPDLTGYYRVELRSDHYWEANPPLEWESVYELLQGRDAAVQIAAVRDPKTVKVLHSKAKAVRGGGRSSIALQVMEVFEEALGGDPAKRYRMERYRRDPAEEELRRRKAQDIINRTRNGPLFVVRIRVYAKDKHLAKELGELVALRFTRPLHVKSPLVGGVVKDSGKERTVWKPAGLLGSPPAGYPWLTVEEIRRMLVLPDPSLVRVEFERGAPLPSVLPRRRGDVRLGVLPDGRVFAVDVEDLYRHLWTIGMTGTGKSTFLLNLALRLHATGRAAVVVIDPHGDLADDLLESLPSLEGVALFDPFRRPFSLNPLELPRARDRDHAVALAVDQVIAIFEKVLRLPESAVNVRYLLQVLMRAFYQRTDSPTLADLYNAIVALKTGELDLPVDDPQWSVQLELLQRLQDQTFISALSRLEPYAGNPLLRRLTGPSTVRLEELLRPGRLVVFRLPKGELGEGVLQLLAPAIVLKLWFYALERAMLGLERTPIFVVIDEFQNLAGLPVVETILSEARKYGLHLIMAHQHTRQLPEELLQSVFSNTAVKVVFQVGGGDVERLGRLDRDFAEAIKRALTSLTVGQALVKITGRPGEQPPPPVLVRMDPPPRKLRTLEEALAGLPRFAPPPEPGRLSPEELLNPVLSLLPRERLSPEELLVLYRVWRASRAGRETVEWTRVLAGLGLRRQRAEEARDSLAAKGLIEAYKEGNRWIVRYMRGLFRGLRTVAPSREGRRLAAKAMLYYLEHGYYAMPARQAGPASPDLIAIPYDRAQLRLRYSEAIAVEIESCNEIGTHSEQVARNLVKAWELQRKGTIRRVEFWTASECAQKLSRILEQAAQQNRIPREAYRIHTVALQEKQEKPKPKPEQQPKPKHQEQQPPEPSQQEQHQEQETITITLPTGHTVQLDKQTHKQLLILQARGYHITAYNPQTRTITLTRPGKPPKQLKTL